jgi:hypothetical protein
MNLLIDPLAGVGPWTQRWLRKMERKLFTVLVAAAIIVLMVAWMRVLAKFAHKLLISVSTR